MYHRGAESFRLTLPQSTQGEDFARRNESSRIDHSWPPLLWSVQLMRKKILCYLETGATVE